MTDPIIAATVSLTRVQCESVAQDTVSRSESVTTAAKDLGASLDSIFIPNQLPPLKQTASPNHTDTSITVANSDSFVQARNILDNDPAAKVAVQNLASNASPGGGWLVTLSKTQEEALCYSSTLYKTLDLQKEHYPWPNIGPGCVAGIFSPGVVIFKDELDHSCVDLPIESHRVVSVITVAAPCGPRLTKGAEPTFVNKSELRELREKIRLVYRMAAHNKQDHLVLGAMGCGAYRCPPRVIAAEMYSILNEPEFKGWFLQVIFACYTRVGDPQDNYFKQEFENSKNNNRPSNILKNLFKF